MATNRKFIFRKAAAFDFSKAPVYRKTAVLKKSQVKIAKARQEVVTLIRGVEETRNVARAGDRIITGDHGERYVVRKRKFASLYEPHPSGRGAYRSKARVRGLTLAENTEIIAPWGERQRAVKGGMIVRRIGRPRDIYLIEARAFARTYAPEKPAPTRKPVNKG
jgi:hypothetical protein